MSANKSLAQNVTPKSGFIGSAFGGGALTGPSIDTAGFSEAAVVLAVGAAGAGTCDVKVQDSADGSTGWADVSGAAFTQVTGSDDNTVQIGMLKLDGNTVRRHIRISSTVATAAIDHGVAVLLVNKQYHPDQTPKFIV